MGLNLNDQEKRLGNYLCEFPMNHCVPFYFGNPRSLDSKVNNGTATLLKKNNKLYVVTNHHVVEEFLKRVSCEEGIDLQIGGLRVTDIKNRIIINDPEIDICLIDFSDCKEVDFHMHGNVTTKFFELGEIRSSISTGKFVAFGGYPGTFRTRQELNQLSFHTFSSGASTVHEVSNSNIVVSINHEESLITRLSDVSPPDEIGGLSGGPVFEISNSGLITTFKFAGIIAECSLNLQVMFAKPVMLFADAFV